MLQEFNLLDQIDVVSLAKQHVSTTAARAPVVKSEERVFLPNRKDPIVLPKNSTALFLLVRIRDEAHRFAITYNRELRRRARLRSALDDIEGIGPVKRRALLRHFGSLKRIREASVEDIAQVKGINRDLPRRFARTSMRCPPCSIGGASRGDLTSRGRNRGTRKRARGRHGIGGRIRKRRNVHSGRLAET